jgi:hypothetical protein
MQKTSVFSDCYRLENKLTLMGEVPYDRFLDRAKNNPSQDLRPMESPEQPDLPEQLSLKQHLWRPRSKLDPRQRSQQKTSWPSSTL